MGLEVARHPLSKIKVVLLQDNEWTILVATTDALVDPIAILGRIVSLTARRRYGLANFVAVTQAMQMQMQWRTKLRELLWLQVLLGGSVLLSIVMILSLWTKLPSHGALRRSPAVVSTSSEQANDLFALVQRHQKDPDTPKSELLHIDDLARSDSFQQWAPIIVSKCTNGMDDRAAPCIKQGNASNMIEAQELLYPAFQLKLPTFVNNEMRARWISQGLHISRMRIAEDEMWAQYPIFEGQNMIFSNALYRGNPPPDIWSNEACMGDDVSHTSFVHSLNDTTQESKTEVDTLVIATSPDSWSFQHFIDRVAVVWSQAQLVIPTTKKTETVILTGRKPRDSIVNEIYEVMVEKHLHNPVSVLAKRLVFSCRAPLIHPYTTRRVTENILQLLPAPSNESDPDRNIILMLSRSMGGKAFNGGRQVLNEPELFDAISKMLNETGRSEKLQYFRHDDFSGLVEVASFVRDRVKMMIGPHGAAFYNSRFAQPRTAVIEIIPDPDKFFTPCFWEQARLLGQDYSAYVATTTTSNNDMTIDNIQEVVRLVENRLDCVDKSYRPTDALTHSYRWNVKV